MAELFYHPESGKQVRVTIGNATAVQPASIIDAECEPLNTSGIFCTIPYDWQEELASTAETEPSTKWVSAAIGMSYKEPFSATDCVRGLPPTTMHFRGGMANQGANIDSPTTLPSECVTYGGGSNDSVKTIDAQALYSLTPGLTP